MTRYAKGRRAEYKTMRVLEAAGYTTLRTAGSHGVADVVALGSTGAVRLISVKSGTARPTAVEREALEELQSQSNHWSVEIWRWLPRQKEPLISYVRLGR